MRKEARVYEKSGCCGAASAFHIKKSDRHNPKLGGSSARSDYMVTLEMSKHANQGY